MSTALQPSPNGLQPGKKYRFTVSSAEEAVQVIRERMGPAARVLSVNQVNGQGLSRFLSSPKLEIIATIPEPPAAQAPAVPAAPASDPPSATTTPPVQHTAPSVAAPTPTPATDPAGYGPKAATNTTASAPTHFPRAAPVHPASKPRRGTLGQTLQRLGFDENLLGSLEAQPSWQEWEKLPLRQGMGEVTITLRDMFARLPNRPLTSRIAFFGTPGVGKTTALCKRLAHDVFLEGQAVSVVKLENDHANPNDALQTFCDVLGVTLQHDTVRALEVTGPLYADLPGMSLYEDALWRECDTQLAQLRMTSRALVLNAAYDLGQMKETISQALRYGATHLVLTHLDEVRSPARLWQLVLGSGLTPWFIAHSQSVTEAVRTDVFAALLERTFPQNLWADLAA